MFFQSDWLIKQSNTDLGSTTSRHFVSDQCFSQLPRRQRPSFSPDMSGFWGLVVKPGSKPTPMRSQQGDMVMVLKQVRATWQG